MHSFPIGLGDYATEAHDSNRLMFDEQKHIGSCDNTCHPVLLILRLKAWASRTQNRINVDSLRWKFCKNICQRNLNAARSPEKFKNMLNERSKVDWNENYKLN